MRRLGSLRSGRVHRKRDLHLEDIEDALAPHRDGDVGGLGLVLRVVRVVAV